MPVIFEEVRAKKLNAVILMSGRFYYNYVILFCQEDIVSVYGADYANMK